MKKLIVFLFIIISFLNVSIYTYADVTAPQQTRSENYKSNDNKYGTEKSPIVIKIQDTKEGKDSAKQSAEYQRIQAVSNERLVIITVILAIIAILQWGIILWQTYLLKKSVEAAKLAADAARDSADVLHVIEKAYVIVTVKNGKPEILFDEIVDVAIRNDGRTPATIIKHKATLYGKEGSLATEAPDIPCGTELGGNRKIIVPILLKKTKPQMARKEAISLCCHVSIEYEDIFKQRYIKESVWEYESSFNCPAGRWNICDNKKLDNYTQANTK